MLELIFSALITILPDYLYRRHKQGKRIGHEITLFNMWYELRWGLTSCAVLAIALITVIFHFHPAATSVSAPFRTVSVLSERAGRVAEVYVNNNDQVKAGDAIFRLDTSRQEAAAETAQRRISEVEATLQASSEEIAVAQAQVLLAEAAFLQVRDDLRRRQDVAQRNETVVSEQELQRLTSAVTQAEAVYDGAQAALRGIEARVSEVLPAQKASAEAMLAEALTEIRLSTVTAEVDGAVTQFLLKPGDLVNPILRPAGILVPDVTGQGRFIATFKQIATPVLKDGMLVEITCAAKPLAIIPMVISERQRVVAAGQFRPGDALQDLQEQQRKGSVLVFLKPVYKGHTDDIPPGSACVGMAYSNRGLEMASGEITGFARLTTSIVDGMGIANAILMRAQAIFLPVRTLVFN